MNDMLTTNIISIFTLAILYVSFLFTPSLTRKDLIFGVFIPLDKTNDVEIKKISKIYYTQITIFTLILYAAYFILLNTTLRTPMMLVLSIYLFLIVYFIIFLKANHKVKAYKAKNNLLENKKQLLYVNTDLSKKLRSTAVLSSYWFIIPALIAILNFILPILNYDKLPSKIGVHFNIAGVADRFVDKSMPSILTNGLMLLILVGLLTLSNYAIAISKNRIDAANPVASSQKLYKFKRFNSLMIYALAILLTALITVFNLNSLNIIFINLDKYMLIQIVLFVIIMILPIILSFKLGQGGSNLKDSVKETIDNNVTNIDDDSFWKLGLIYYNPNDPSIVVEKRFGIGWTLNFGNKVTMVISVIFLLFMVAIIALPIIFH